jgi:protein gp37
MADNTHIEWTEATWNPITGCSVTSPGCTNCYAMQLAGTRLADHPSRAGLTREVNGNHVWTGEVRFNEQWLDQPLRWKRPRMIFVCAHGDLFHESVPDAWIDRVFAVMALAPQHTFQVLTKRAARMREYLARACGRIGDQAMLLRKTDLLVGKGLGPNGLGPLPHIEPGREWWPLPNVWLGVSVEDQQRADERIPDLLATPAAVRWISAEPLLGPVNLNSIHEVFDDGCLHTWESALDGKRFSPWVGDDEDPMIPGFPKLDWVVAGGESGKGARPMHPDWARSLRDQCAAADVPFFFKQWGEWELALDREKDDPDWRADYSNNYVDHGKSRWLNIEGGRGFHGERFVVMRQVGKKRAGRLLDGVEHNGMPEVRA